jgi:hypothetical protein
MMKPIPRPFDRVATGHLRAQAQIKLSVLGSQSVESTNRNNAEAQSIFDLYRIFTTNSAKQTLDHDSFSIVSGSVASLWLSSPWLSG